MALPIDAEIERLATEIAQITGKSSEEAFQKALAERKERLGLEAKERRIDRGTRWLREEVWPSLPPEVRGKRVAEQEWDALNDEEQI